MGFLALIVALLIDQGRNLTIRQLVIEQLETVADALRRLTDMGGRFDGWKAWGLMMVVSSALAIGLDWFAARSHVLLQFALHVVVLYLFIGFRRFSGPFSAIQRAFSEGDPSRAFIILQAWLRGRDLEDQAVLASGSATEDFDSNVVCRQAIDHALIASHRHVFGPLLAYILLPGILGPVIYRVAEVLLNRWHHPVAEAAGDVTALSIEDSDRHRLAAQRGFSWIDWIPVRLNAAGLTVVGNFEDAVFCWRGAVASRASLVLRQAAAALAIDESRAILLATASGALNLRLADPALEGHWVSEGFEWQGALPDPSGLRSAVGLVWRNAVLWVSFFAILTMAGWLGR
jgi:cobalamin biosynthesis protein CobD/CbiB